MDRQIDYTAAVNASRINNVFVIRFDQELVGLLNVESMTESSLEKGE